MPGGGEGGMKFGGGPGGAEGGGAFTPFSPSSPSAPSSFFSAGFDFSSTFSGVGCEGVSEAGTGSYSGCSRSDSLTRANAYM